MELRTQTFPTVGTGHEAPAHRRLQQGPWWQKRVTTWSDVTPADFNNHRWQYANSVTSAEQLLELVAAEIPEAFADDVRRGFALAPMAVRVTPYVLSLIDWKNPWADPIRRQFIPVASEAEPDHPMCTLDSLEEQRDAVAPGLTRRYPDKVLFLALDVCPVYCRFCTRSYAIGGDTETVDKMSLPPGRARWSEALDWIHDNDEVEDVVVSGGDTWLLSATMIRDLGDRLLDIPHLRRIRFATKGLAVLPQKILSDPDWLDALTHVVEKGRARGVHVPLHTHFNHPREITSVTAEAAYQLFQRGIVMRNQTVLQRGVNDSPECMTTLMRRLSWLQIQPYYVYVHDMVPGVETLRTSLGEAVEIERAVRGMTAGFNTPTFVCDAMGGGGKRDAHSFEHYDQSLGIAVYRSHAVDPDRPFFYYDPLRELDPEAQAAWLRPKVRENMISGAVQRAGFARGH